MLSWRQRLCGSEVQSRDDQEAMASLKTFMNPCETLSSGGSFFPTVDQNMANLATTSSKNIVFPTEDYSVLVFKDDGSAVIYSDTEAPEDPEENLF